MPFFSIITPTLQRESLLATCESVNRQSFKGWEHIVMVDSENYDEALIASIQHPQRIIEKCGMRHSTLGNTCRHNAWKLATGDYAMYLDDDNILADDTVLEAIRLRLLIKGVPQVAFFPIWRLGGIFMPEGRPRSCHVDTANLVVAREIGQWPDIPEYTSDGIFVEALLEKFPYASFPDFKPIVIMHKISEAK